MAFRNDFGDSVTIHKACELIYAYRTARSFYDKEQSGRWALWSVNQATWHGGTDPQLPRPEQAVKRKWFNNTQKIKASFQRLNKLLATVHPELPTVLEGKVPKLSKSERLGYSYYPKSSDTIRLAVGRLLAGLPEYKKARKNYQKIANRRIGHTTWYRWIVEESHVLDWAKIRRGKQLFIKGWGGFNIERVFQSEGQQTFLPPIAVQSIGYGIPVYDPTKIIQNRRLKEWMARYKNWWWPKDLDLGIQRRNRLDEVLRYLQLVYDNPSILPDDLFRHLREYSQRNTLFSEPEPLLEQEFEWTDKITPHREGELIVKPIKNTQQMIATGTALSNCTANSMASHYNRRIANKRCALMVCTDDNGNPLALAEVEFGQRVGLGGGSARIVQVSGPNNAPVPEQIRKAYLNCLEQMTGSPVEEG